MLRVITLIGIALVLVSGALAQTVGMSRPPKGLPWTIHTQREEGYSCSNNTDAKPWRVDEVTFDRQGNETFRRFYNADGSIGHQVSKTYDSNGNVTGWSEFYGKGDFPTNGLHKHAEFTLLGEKVISGIVYKEDTPEYRSTSDYDERGNKIRETSVQIGCCTTTRTFKYDGQNRILETTSDSPGYVSVQRRAYDAAGNVVEETYYDNGILVITIKREFDGSRFVKEVRTSRGRIRTTINTYNKSGDVVLITIDDPSITSKTTIEYHDNGKMRSKDQVTVAKAGPPQGSEDSPNPGRILEKYDVNGKQIERYVYDDKGALYLTQMSSYDDQGRQIRLTETAASDHKYNRDVVYEYDSHGNRITALCRKVTDSGEVKLFPAEKKIITYFDN